MTPELTFGPHLCKPKARVATRKTFLHCNIYIKDFKKMTSGHIMWPKPIIPTFGLYVNNMVHFKAWTHLNCNTCMTFYLFYGKLNDVKIDPRWWAWKFDMPLLHHSMKEGYNLLSQNSLLFGSILNKQISPFPLAFRMYSSNKFWHKNKARQDASFM